MLLQVGDRTLLAELFQIVSERADTKFKFLSLSPNIYLSGPEATAMAQASLGKALNLGDDTRAGRPKGTQFIHAKVKYMRLPSPSSNFYTRIIQCRSIC